MANPEVSYIIRAKEGYLKVHKGADEAIDKTAKNMVKAAGVMSVAVAGVSASLFAITKTTADSGDEFQKMSARLGISSQALSEMKHATELSGASLQTYEMGLRKLSKGALEADRGMATYKRTFDELGISVRDANGQMKDSDALFMEVVEGLNAVESSTKKTALAQELLGRSGTMLLPLINAGADGIKEMREEAVALGITFSEIDANESAEFVDAMLRVKGSVVGLKDTFGKELLPVFTTVMNQISQSFIEFKEEGDLDVWAADVSEGVITSFSVMAVFISNIPAAWNATMVAVKTSAAGLLAALRPVALIFEKWEGQSGGFGSADMAKKWAENQGKIVEDTKSFSDQIDELAISLLVSADANEVSGEKWAEWQLTAVAAIDTVVKKSKEATIDAGTTAAAVISPAAGITAKETGELAPEDDPEIQSIALKMQFRDEEIAQLTSLTEAMEFHAERGVEISADMAASIIADNQRIALSADARANVGAAADDAMADSMLALVETGKFSASAFAKVMAEEVKTELVGLAAKASVRALYETGLGFATLFTNPPESAGHFTAAGHLAGVGAVSLAGAATVSSLIGGSSGGSSASSSSGSVSASDQSLVGTSDEPVVAAQDITIIIKGEVVTAETIEKLIEPIVDGINKGGLERGITINAEAIAT